MAGKKLNAAGNIKKYPIYIFLSGILLLQIICLLYYANQKAGYHSDEVATYTLSNSYYRGFFNREYDTSIIKGFFNKEAIYNLYDEWLDKEYFLRELTADTQTFAYGSVWSNNARDVHPPLFYYIHHTVSSFFPNTFSKWIGIVPNILYFVLTAIILFLLSRKMLKNEWLALLVCVIWGFSAGAVSSVMFIRMYALLTFFVVWNVYLHYCLLLYTDEKKRRLLIGIGLCTFLGFSTQYYYIISAFLISASYCLYLIITKKRKEVFVYARTMLISMMVCVLHFPVALAHILLGYQGAAAVDNFSNRVGMDYLRSYFRFIDRDLFGSFGRYFIAAFLIILAGIIIFSIFKFRISDGEGAGISIELNLPEKTAIENKAFRLNLSKDRLILLNVTLICVVFVIIIAQISPFLVNRYIMCVYPLIILCFVKGVYSIYAYRFKSLKIFIAIFLCIFAFINFHSYRSGDVDYLYKDQGQDAGLILDTAVTHVIYIGNRGSGSPAYHHIPFLLLSEKVYITDGMDSIEFLEDILRLDKNASVSEQIILYIDSSFEQEDVLEEIANHSDFVSHRELFGDIYLLER